MQTSDSRESLAATGPMGRVRAALAGAILLTGLASGATWGVTIDISGNGGANTATATRATCTGYIDGKAYVNCASNAFVTDTASVAGNDAEFKKAFDAWNATLAAATKWSLVNGGNLPGTDPRFAVTTFNTTLGNTTGSMEIKVEWNYTGADKTDYVWSQGLLDNYKISPAAIVPPFYEMDNAASTTTPAYPFQYPERYFYDKPTAPLSNGSFQAWAMLTKIDTATRTLTAYEGINYGFTLSATLAPVPEPYIVTLILPGLLVVVARCRRRRMKA